ncbi:MAG: nucleotide exchange factor GrpE [Gammaproteobacteria bacterium]|nr:nucleotide exchange factor GrpE [Gammaproteobacteria bacterium]
MESEAGMPDNDAAIQPEPAEKADGPETQAELEQALVAAEARAEENWNQYLRTAAELENVRKRVTRDVERARKFGLEPLFLELLTVRDSLEMGLAAADSEPTIEALREGTQMTLRQLQQVMDKFQVEEIDPAGEPFDPTLHEAMTIAPTTEVAPDTVVEVVQKGYQLHGRLLRPARVIVARAPD